MQILSKKRIIDFFVYGAGQAINLVSPLLIMPFIIYHCGEALNGKIGVGFAICLILNGIVDYGSYVTGVKDISINRDNPHILSERLKSIYLSKFILLGAVLSVYAVMIFTVPFLAKDKPLFLLSMFIVVGQALNPAWFFQGIENFKWISLLNVLSKVSYISLVFLFVQQKSDYIYVNLYLGVCSIAASLIGVFFLVRKYHIAYSGFVFSHALDIIRNEFSFSFSQFFLSLYQYFPIVIISYMAGDTIAGQFRAIDSIISLFRTYLNMFFYFIYANICYELHKNRISGLKTWLQLNGLNFLLLTVLLTVFYLNAEMILAYYKINPAIITKMSLFFRIGLMIPLLVGLSQPLRQLMFAFNENKKYIQITISATIVNIMLLLVLTKQFELKGCFLSIIITESIIIVLYLLILKKHARLNSETS